MKRLLTFILLLSLVFTCAITVGTAFADGEPTTTVVSETERIAVSFRDKVFDKNGDQVLDGVDGGFFGSDGSTTLAAGESMIMEFTIKNSHIPMNNYNVIVLPTTTDLVEATGSWPYSHFLFCGNFATSDRADKLQLGGQDYKDAVFSGVFNPVEVLTQGYTVKFVYSAPTTTDGGAFAIYKKPDGSDDSLYAEAFSVRNIPASLCPTATDKIYFVFGVNGVPANINSEDPTIGKFYMEIANTKIYTTQGENFGFAYNDKVTKKKVDDEIKEFPDMRFEKFTVEEGEDDKVLNLVANNVNGQEGNVTYYYNHSVMENGANIKFSVPNGDDGLKLVLDKDMSGLDGTEIALSVPTADFEYFDLTLDGTDAILSATNDLSAGYEEIDRVACVDTAVYFGFNLANQGSIAKNVYIDNLSIRKANYEYDYGFNDGIAMFFTTVGERGNFAMVHSTVYDVTYYGLDGELISTQRVGYANNAIIPVELSQIANVDQVIAQSNFIDSNRAIYVERVDDDKDFIVVLVENGTLDSGEVSKVLRAGDTVTAVLGEVPVGREFTGWMVDGEYVGYEDTLVYTAQKSTTLTAYLAKTKHTVTVDGGAIVTVNGVEGYNDETLVLEYGDVVTVKAYELDPIIDAGSAYAGWYQDGEKITASNQMWFTLTNDTVLTALKVKDTVEITISNGHVDGQTSLAVPYGTEIVAVPNSAQIGREFSHWMFNNEIIDVLDTLGDTTYIFEATESGQLTAVYKAIIYTVTVENGTVNGETSAQIGYGSYANLVANEVENKSFVGWYEGDELVSTQANYSFEVERDITLTAKYGDKVGGGCGCGCGTIAGNGGMGGMLMLIGMVAVALLVMTAIRKGKVKNFSKIAGKALVLVLCVTMFASVAFGGAVVPELGDKVLVNETEVGEVGGATGGVVVDKLIDTAEETFYFPCVEFGLAEDVIVQLTMTVDRNSSLPIASKNDYAILKLYTTGNKFVDDALPMGVKSKITYETKVVMHEGSFAVALKVTNAEGAKIVIEDVKIMADDLTDNLLAGTVMYMIPSATTEQNMSFVIKTESGKVIVVDGGVKEDATYLTNFLYSIKTNVDHWFITHYHSDHIGAVGEILKGNKIQIDNLYFNFPVEEEIYTYGEVGAGEVGVITDPNSAYNTFINNLDKVGNVVKTTAGQIIQIDEEVSFKVVNDPQLFTIPASDKAYNYGNNTTVVYRMNTAAESVLFLGDAGVELGNYLLYNMPDDVKGCEIVQTAHHGQNGTDANFYKEIGGRVYLNCAPYWVWYEDATGAGLNSFASVVTLECRQWFREVGVVRNYVMKDGLATIR